MEIHPRCAHPHDIRRFWGLDRVRRTYSIFSAEIAKRAESKNLVEILGRSDDYSCYRASPTLNPRRYESVDGSGRRCSEHPIYNGRCFIEIEV